MGRETARCFPWAPEPLPQTVRFGQNSFVRADRRRRKCAIPTRNAKAKLRIEDGPHQQLLRRSRARGTAFQARTELGQARSELLSAEDSSSPDRRETCFLVRAIDRGLEASRPQELSSRMRSDTRQTRAPVFHKQKAQALAFPFLSLKEEV